MKTDISNIHLEVLDNIRQEVLNKIIPATTHFLLGGGTALALQIAHRQSFDFDFFSDTPIAGNLAEKLSHLIQIEEIVVDSGDELTFYDNNRIKFTFLSYYFKPYYETVEVSNGLNIFSTQEIAIKKAYTIGRRGAYRDYFDLYTILKNNYSSLEEVMSISEKVYASLFNPKLFLEQLVYFADLTDFVIEPVGSAPVPPPETVKQYLENLVLNYMSK